MISYFFTMKSIITTCLIFLLLSCTNSDDAEVVTPTVVEENKELIVPDWLIGSRVGIEKGFVLNVTKHQIKLKAFTHAWADYTFDGRLYTIMRDTPGIFKIVRKYPWVATYSIALVVVDGRLVSTMGDFDYSYKDVYEL